MNRNSVDEMLGFYSKVDFIEPIGWSKRGFVYRGVIPCKKFFLQNFAVFSVFFSKCVCIGKFSIKMRIKERNFQIFLIFKKNQERIFFFRFLKSTLTQT